MTGVQTCALPISAVQLLLLRRKGLLDNGDPNFKNGKEKIYDRLPVTAKQMDLVVKVLEAAIVVVLAVALLDKYLF